MKIWDIHPGYLSRDMLLAEYGDVQQLAGQLKRQGQIAVGIEQSRWLGCNQALVTREAQLVCEMALRGMPETPDLAPDVLPGDWPGRYADKPGTQFKLLEARLAPGERGRIPLPRNAQQLWAQHKYSVMARDPQLYKQIGRELADNRSDFAELAHVLAEALRNAPDDGNLGNTVQHMWGYVAPHADVSGEQLNAWSLRELLYETQRLTVLNDVDYLNDSTALSDLMVWLLNE